LGSRPQPCILPHCLCSVPAGVFRQSSMQGRSCGVLVLLCAQLWRLCAAGGAGDLYCGRDDCYGLLGLARSAEIADIKKAYRRLALQWHPDKNRSPEAPERFRKISRAHEVLSDETLRHAYDYYLDHPEDRYMHYYQYYRAVYTPKTPLWAVAVGILTFLSGLQYVNRQWAYAQTWRLIRYQPTFKRRVNELFDAELASFKAKLSRMEKEVLRERVEQQVFESEVRISGSGGSRPSVGGLIGVRAALLPVDICRGLYSFARWHWRFSVRGEEYGEEEKAYLTRRALGLPDSAWAGLEPRARGELLARELWRPEHLQAYAAEQEEQLRERRSQSGAYKRAKRWMKNH